MPEIKMSEILKIFPNPEEVEVMDEQQRAAYDAIAPRREELSRQIVFGHDYKSVKGEPVEQGIGARGRETMNHFTSCRKYEGEEAYWSEVARVWKETPEHAEKLAKQGLPKPKDRTDPNYLGALAMIWKSDPKLAKDLGLPKPQERA